MNLISFLLTDLGKRGWGKENVREIKTMIREAEEETEWRKREARNRIIWEKLREGYTETAAEKVKTEYQAPSFLHSLWSEAGRRTGKVYGNMNDYTRDQHPNAYELGQELKNTYQPMLKGIEAHVTISGMAALSTVLNALGRMGIRTSTILVGQESYFQNREVLTAWGGKVISFDEQNLPLFKRLINQEKPAIVIVDSLSNTEKLVRPEIRQIQQIIKENATQITYLLVDNSMLGPGVGYKDLWKERGRCETIIWESLNKYFQYGMDHTTGGVIWARGIKLNGEIFRARMHTGTIMPDYQCLMMPRQNAMIMKEYIKQLGSNRDLLTKILGERGKKVRVAVGKGFGGVQIVVELEKTTPWKINSLITRVIREARRRGVQISSGTSFGLPTTRIYLTARKTSYARMFCRISVGWEGKEAIREIGEVLTKVL